MTTKRDFENVGVTTGGTCLDIMDSGLQMNEVASVPGAAIAATEGRVWLKSDTPNTLWFTDDAGTDTQLGAGGGGGTALDSAATSENVWCARPTGTPTVDGAKPGQVNLGTELVVSHGTSGNYATISGGYNNIASGAQSVVCGGYDNDATGTNSIILGGRTNVTSGEASIVGGQGITNVSQYGSCIFGRSHTTVEGNTHFMGGRTNQIVKSTSTYNTCFGHSNIIGSASYKTDSCTILGGGGNQIVPSGGEMEDCAIVGGKTNSITSGDNQFIGGGFSNLISANDHNVIVGGYNNTNTGTQAFLGAGKDNIVTGDSSVICGGNGNSMTSSSYASIAGGLNNTITTAAYGALGGGYLNVVGGSYSACPGGSSNATDAANCFAAGTRAKSNHAGTFVWADDTAADVASVAVKEFHVGSTNGIRLSHTTEEHGFITSVDEAQTTDVTVTTLRTISMIDNSALLITARIIGMETDGTNRNAYVLTGLFYRDGAGVVLEGAVSRDFEVESDAAWTADLSVSTNDVIVTVTGGASVTTVNWRTTVQSQLVS